MKNPRETKKKKQKNQSHISKSIAKPLEKLKKKKQKNKDFTDPGHGAKHVPAAAWSGFGKSLVFLFFLSFSNGFAMLFEMQL